MLRQGTPFYAGYRLRPLGEASLDEIVGSFDETRAGFLHRLLATGKTGRSWTTLAPDDAAAALGEDRSRIVAALEYLDQQGLVELQPADVRQRYTILARPDSRPALVEQLLERFARREQAETARIGSVLELVTHDGCQVGALVGYFGETRTEPCGHCTHCLTGRAQLLPEPEPKPPVAASVDAGRGRSTPREPSRRPRHREAAGPVPRRDHEPGNEPRAADPGAAVRLARRPPVRRHPRLVRVARRLDRFELIDRRRPGRVEGQTRDSSRTCAGGAFRPARTPPSIGSVVPVIQPARAPARKRIASTTSTG